MPPSVHGHAWTASNRRASAGNGRQLAGSNVDTADKPNHDDNDQYFRADELNFGPKPLGPGRVNRAEAISELLVNRSGESCGSLRVPGPLRSGNHGPGHLDAS